VLEDETGRVRLQGLPPGELVTGIPLALKGAIVHGGEFLVEDYCVAGLPPQPDLPLEFTEDSAYVALISGLNLGHADTDDLGLSLLADYLGGLLGSRDEQEFNASLVRIILVGNNVCGIKSAEEGILSFHSTFANVRLQGLFSSTKQRSKSTKSTRRWHVLLQSLILS
jgi:DNA polymerase delta subunit 2